jgi:ATP-dependent Clp protease protease subunit
MTQVAPEFHVDDIISSNDWYGEGGVSSRAMRDFLAANAKAPEVVVRINSVGGDAFEGVAMASALKRHGARVIVEVDGIAASAASVVAMAGDEIRVHQGAMLMIHEAHALVVGTASDFGKRANLLLKINGEIADLYAARTGQTRAKCLELMAAETWMGADEAKRLGFATSVIPAKSKPAEPTAKSHSQASALLASYRNAPPALRGAVLNQYRSPLAELAAGTTTDEPLKWHGRTYEDLAPLERAQLKRVDVALFNAMRAQPGKPRAFAELTGPQRAELRRADPALYDRMRNGSAETYRPAGHTP